MPQATAPSLIRQNWLVVAASLGFSAFVFALLPSGVVVLNDDFGYLRSVVQTLQHGRPWTDDWLEPWAASLSALVSLLYGVTGKFHLSAYGMVALLAGMSFGISCRLLLLRGLSLRAAFGGTLLLLTIPTVLWKSLEFTSMVVYIPCLLAAIWATETKRWWLFAIAWVLAVTSRQSALVWLVMPGLEVAKIIWQRQNLTHAVQPGLVCTGGVLFFGWFGSVMNQTHSQAVLTQHLLAQASVASAARALGVGSLLYLLAAGWSALFAPANPGSRLQNRTTVTLTLLFAAGLLCFDGWCQLIEAEQPTYIGPYGWLYLRAALVIAAAGWIRRGFSLTSEKVIYVAACLAPVCLRADLWDYYFLDVVVLGFFSTKGHVGAGACMETRSGWERRIAATVVLIIVLLQIRTTWLLKLSLDDARASNTVAEHAMRAGLLKPTETGFAPFGYRGWYLHEYHASHEGKADPNIAGLHRYLNWDATTMVVRYRGLIRWLPGYAARPVVDPATVIIAESHAVGWFFRADYTLIRRAPMGSSGGATPIITREFHVLPFPLNDAEWHDLVKNKPVTSLTAAEIDYARLSPNQREAFRIITPRPVRFFSTFGPELWFAHEPGRERFMAQPSTKLWFALSPGIHRLRTDLKLEPNAWQDSPYADGSDGVELVATAVFTDGRRTVLNRRPLDPRSHPADRGVQPIDWTFELSDGAELELSVTAGPAENGARDWASLGSVTID